MGTHRFGRRPEADEVVAGQDLSGRVAVVTGSNAGIGYEAARALAGAGARVYLACRNAQKGMAAAARIKVQHPDAYVEFLALDLASPTSVRAFAAGFPEQVVHILVCNAGLYAPKYTETEDGFERTVGVCHLGHFLLTHELLGCLKAGRPARVVVVSSGSHRFPRRLNFDRLPLNREHYNDLVAYGQAKLCNVLFANELTRRYQAEGVTANSLHPGGLIGTEISRSSLAAKFVFLLARPFAKTLSQGAATTVYCAVAPELEGVGGRYFENCREKNASAEAQDPAVAKRLWELTEGWLKLR